MTSYKVAHRLGSVDFFAGGKYTSMDLKMDLDLSDVIENRIATRVDQLPPKFRDPVLRLTQNPSNRSSVGTIGSEDRIEPILG